MSNGLNVLSLFDGMSGGRISLERAGFKIDNYFASEIKKHAIKVTMENYPDTIQLGSVMDYKEWDLPKIDILIGGSPCQDFSVLKKDGKGLEGEKSRLFFKYLECLKHFKPKYFLLENVKMKKEDQDIISNYLGVEPIKINSKLVSYQSRTRLYWTNIPNVTVPEDRNINFQDYKETDYEICKQYKVNDTPSRRIMWGNGVDGKCKNVTHAEKLDCLTTKQDRWSNAGLIEFDDFCRFITREEAERAQTVPIGYTKCLTINQAYDVLGDGWTIDVLSHIFSFMKKEENTNEIDELEILKQKLQEANDKIERYEKALVNINKTLMEV